MKIQNPFDIFFQSANRLFHVALGDGYTPQQACAAIRDLTELRCVLDPALILPVRVDPTADGVIITDATGATFDGARVLLRPPGPEGLRLKTAQDRRIDELVGMLGADALMDRDEAFNALAERYPDLTDSQFDHIWAAAHRELQITPKPGPKPGRPRKRKAVRKSESRDSRKRKIRPAN